MPNWIGISYPVAAGEQGFFNVDENDKLIRGNILQIIGTNRGERVMLPEFGTRIRQFIHDPLDSVSEQLIKVEVIDSIKRWEPRVKLLRINVTENKERGEIVLSLFYVLINDPNERMLDVRIDKNGGMNV